MSKLDWNNFDGTQFQKFCNSLLLFTVSKFAQVFSAPGKDGGVDQLYKGSHDSKNGLWRFQDKFHHSGKKTADVAALKKDVLLDITQNYKNENFIVIITNINLTFSKYAEINKVANELLQKLNISDCEFILWHEATLEGLLSNYPVIYNWYWERDSALLQPYELYFSNQLREDNYELRNQLKNVFFGRGTQLSYLDQFIQNSDKLSLAVIANGGYGKTRLVIQFLKTYISKKDEWMPLVMSHTGFNPSYFANLLKTKKKLIIFLDNAHEVPDIFKEVKRLIDNSLGKDKLIITTRPTLFSEIFEKLPSHGKNLEKLLLPKLTYDETKLMFQSELPGLKNRNLVYLSEISKGVPNVILEFIRLVKLGKQPSKISSEEAFNQSVKEIFSEAINDIEKKTQISKEKINDFLRLISLISPLKNDNKDKEFVEKFIDLRRDKLELLINELSSLNFLDTSQSLSIKPDPYSDSILTDTLEKNKTFIEHVKNHHGAENYLENILKNLSEAEIESAEKEYFIDSLIYGYVSMLQDVSTPNIKIKEVYEFVEKIVIGRPRYGIFVIKELIVFHTNIDHLIHKQSEKWSDKTYYNEIAELAKSILVKLCTYSPYAYVNKEEIHELIKSVISVTDDLNILSNCYGFHEWNFPYFGYNTKECCERQLFLKSIICGDLISTGDISNLNVALKAADFLMRLEFEIERYFESSTMQMHFGHAQVPYCKHIEEIRTDIINALIICFNNSSQKDIKDKIFNLLLHHIYFCTKHSLKEHKQNITSEIFTVLNFLNSLLDDRPNTLLKNKILGHIQRYERSEFQEIFQESIGNLKAKASTSNSLYEALEMNMLNGDYFDTKNNLELRITKLIEQYNSFKTFKDDLIKIKLAISETYNNFQGILSILSKSYSEEAKVLFDEIKVEHPQLISESIYLIGENYKNEKYFYETISWLWERKDNYLNTFFWLISWGRNKDRNFYKPCDLDYYEYLIDNKLDSQNLDFIAYNLIDYAYIDKKRTFTLLNRFIKAGNQEVMNRLGYTIFDKKEQYSLDFTDEIKELFLSNFDKINFSNFNNNLFLQFLETRYGFDDLFKFIDSFIGAIMKQTITGDMILTDFFTEMIL